MVSSCERATTCVIICIVEILFDDVVWVHYGFMFLSSSDGETPDLADSRAGQTNGLLGGSVPRSLSMITATHTGEVPVRVEWHRGAPPVDSLWEDVVEVSVEIADTNLTLSAFQDFYPIDAPTVGWHRARYNAAGMDAASEPLIDDDQGAPDRYLLQLWPAASTPDQIVRQTARVAGYWHGVAQEQPPITAEEIASHRAALASPAPVVPWSVPSSADTGLDVLKAFPLSVKVLVPAWLARRACLAADIADLGDVPAALAALKRHEALPARFEHLEEALAALPMPAAISRERALLALRTIVAASATDPLGDFGPLLAAAHAAVGSAAPDLVSELCAEFGFDT